MGRTESIRWLALAAACWVAAACTSGDEPAAERDPGPSMSSSGDELDAVADDPPDANSSASTAPAGARFATEAVIDPGAGAEPVWIDDSNNLHAGRWSIAVEVPNASPVFVAEQAALDAHQVRGATVLAFAHPVEGVEDPANLYQLVAVTDAGLVLVYRQVLGHTTELIFSEDGASYVEWLDDACRSGSGAGAVVSPDEVFLGPGPDGDWAATGRRSTGETFECQELAG